MKLSKIFECYKFSAKRIIAAFLCILFLGQQTMFVPVLASDISGVTPETLPGGNHQYNIDPSKLIKIGFYALYGDEIISNITNYWKEQLKSSRREDNKPTTTVVKKPQNKDSFSKIHRHSAEIAYGDDFL